MLSALSKLNVIYLIKLSDFEKLKSAFWLGGTSKCTVSSEFHNFNKVQLFCVPPTPRMLQKKPCNSSNNSVYPCHELNEIDQQSRVLCVCLYGKHVSRLFNLVGCFCLEVTTAALYVYFVIDLSQHKLFMQASDWKVFRLHSILLKHDSVEFVCMLN